MDLSLPEATCMHGWMHHGFTKLAVVLTAISTVLVVVSYCWVACEEPRMHHRSTKQQYKTLSHSNQHSSCCCIILLGWQE
jgi:hypothetical protein